MGSAPSTRAGLVCIFGGPCFIKGSIQHCIKVHPTHYSASCSWNFRGSFLGVCETIWRLSGGHVAGVLIGILRKTIQKTKKNLIFLLLSNIALNRLFNEYGVRVASTDCNDKARRLRTRDTVAAYFKKMVPREG